jgi:hypothetical protein
MAMVDPQDARAERDREETQERNERKREREREKEIYERNSKKKGSSVFCTNFSHLQFKIDSKTRLIVVSARKQYASCMWFSQQ